MLPQVQGWACTDSFAQVRLQRRRGELEEGGGGREEQAGEEASLADSMRYDMESIKDSSGA
jgi:hypothetical protein